MMKKITIFLKIPLEALKNFNTFLVTKTFLNNYVGDLLVKLGLFLYTTFLDKTKRRTLFTIFRIIPKIIVLLALIVDIFIFSKFYFVCLTSPFLLLPLIEKVIIYNLETFCKENFEQLDEILEISEKNTGVVIKSQTYLLLFLFGDPTLILKLYMFGLTSSYLSMFDLAKLDYQETLEKFQTFFVDVLFPIQTFLFIYNADTQKIMRYANQIFSIVAMSIWSYVIIKIW